MLPAERCSFCSDASGPCVSLLEPANFVVTAAGSSIQVVPSLAEVISELAQTSSADEQSLQLRSTMVICVAGCLTRLTGCYEFLQLVRTAAQRIASETATKVELVEPGSEEEYLEDEVDNTIDLCDESTEETPSTRAFVLPRKSLIVTHLQFENFDYIEFSGERCCGCNEFFDDVDQLNEHSRQNHGAAKNRHTVESDRTCYVCKEWFATLEDLAEHHRYYTSKEIFLCKLCGQSFHSKEGLMAHMEDANAHELRNESRSQSDVDLPNNIVATGDEEQKQCSQLDVDAQDDLMTAEDEILVQQKLDKTDSQKDTLATKTYDVQMESTISGRYDVEESDAASVGTKPNLPDEKLILSIQNLVRYQVVTLNNAAKCCACGIYLGSIELLLEHAQQDHPRTGPTSPEVPSCEVCGDSFATTAALTAHQSGNRNIRKVYRCRTCQLVYTQRKLFSKHIKTQHPSVEEKLPRKTSVSKRTTKPPEKLGFACCFLKCSSVFNREAQLQQHVIKLHAARKKLNCINRTSDEHVCNVCLRNFASRQLLQIHCERTFRKKHICTYCGEGFLVPSKLQEHEQLVHFSSSLPQHPCDRCVKVFRTEKLLNSHQRTHDVTREYSCDQCAAQFRFQFQLRKHIDGVHPTSFPYECTFCEKSFSTKPKHDLHLRTHTGEKPFVCRYESCGKQFAHGTDRKRHEAGVHEGERTHRCGQCPAVYLRKRELRLHSQKHLVSFE